MPLNVPAIRAAKGGEKPYKLFDDKGLFLLVTPQGSKLWRVKYRFAHKDQLLSLGAYPAVTLKQARAGRDEVRRQVAAGIVRACYNRAEHLSERRQMMQAWSDYLNGLIQGVVV